MTQAPIPASFKRFVDDSDVDQYWFNSAMNVVLIIYTDDGGGFQLCHSDERGCIHNGPGADIAEAKTWDELVANTRTGSTYAATPEWRERLACMLEGKE